MTNLIGTYNGRRSVDLVVQWRGWRLGPRVRRFAIVNGGPKATRVTLWLGPLHLTVAWFPR